MRSALRVARDIAAFVARALSTVGSTSPHARRDRAWHRRCIRSSAMMTSLTAEQLDAATGGLGTTPLRPATRFTPKIGPDGRRVWVITKKELLRENQGFPLDPRP
jgi:hypothetical protein